MAIRVCLQQNIMEEPVFCFDAPYDGTLDHHSFNLSSALANSIDEWDREYKSFYNPGEYEFRSEHLYKAYKENFLEGKVIAEKMQEELGDEYCVKYVSKLRRTRG